jgi:hypothetical protein
MHRYCPSMCTAITHLLTQAAASAVQASSMQRVRGHADTCRFATQNTTPALLHAARVYGRSGTGRAALGTCAALSGPERAPGAACRPAACSSAVASRLMLHAAAKAAAACVADSYQPHLLQCRQTVQAGTRACRYKYKAAIRQKVTWSPPWCLSSRPAAAGTSTLLAASGPGTCQDTDTHTLRGRQLRGHNTLTHTQRAAATMPRTDHYVSPPVGNKNGS